MLYLAAFFAAFFVRTFGFWATKWMKHGAIRVLVASAVTLAVVVGFFHLVSDLDQPGDFANALIFVEMQLLWVMIDLVTVLLEMPILGTQVLKRQARNG